MHSCDWTYWSDNIYEPSIVWAQYFIKVKWEWEDGGLDGETFIRNNNGFCPYECSSLIDMTGVGEGKEMRVNICFP